MHAAGTQHADHTQLNIDADIDIESEDCVASKGVAPKCEEIVAPVSKDTAVGPVTKAVAPNHQNIEIDSDGDAPVAENATPKHDKIDPFVSQAIAPTRKEIDDSVSKVVAPKLVQTKVDGEGAVAQAPVETCCELLTLTPEDKAARIVHRRYLFSWEGYEWKSSRRLHKGQPGTAGCLGWNEWLDHVTVGKRPCGCCVCERVYDRYIASEYAAKAPLLINDINVIRRGATYAS